MHWTRFNEHCARRSTRGKVRDLDGARAVWSHTILIVNNLTAPSGALADASALARCGRAAAADAATFQLPWMFGIPRPWLPVPLDEANAILADAGLKAMMYMTVMECSGPLADPVRPLPAAVDVRRVDSPAVALDALNINCLAYGMPAAVADDVLAANVYFADPSTDFGFVVYSDGKPVSTATAIDLGDCVYIAAVATDPGHRQKGYAEVAMRAALAAAPSKPSFLDASRTGEPLYAQMGYQRRFQWNFWVPA